MSENIPYTWSIWVWNALNDWSIYDFCDWSSTQPTAFIVHFRLVPCETSIRPRKVGLEATALVFEPTSTSSDSKPHLFEPSTPKISGISGHKWDTESSSSFIDILDKWWHMMAHDGTSRHSPVVHQVHLWSFRDQAHNRPLRWWPKNVPCLFDLLHVRIAHGHSLNAKKSSVRLRCATKVTTWPSDTTPRNGGFNRVIPCDT